MKLFSKFRERLRNLFPEVLGFKDFDDVEVEIALDHYGAYFNSLNGIRYLTYDGITVHKISDFGFKVKYSNGAFDHSSSVFSIFNKFLYGRDLDFPSLGL